MARTRRYIYHGWPDNFSRYVGINLSSFSIFIMAVLITLVDQTGRVLRNHKRGAIHSKTANILARLNITSESWIKLTTDFETIFTGAVGTAEHLSEFSEHVGLQRAHGIANAKACLNSG